MTRRAQITIPDIVYFGAGMVILAALAQPLYYLLNENASELGTGTVMLSQLLVPGLLMTMLVIFFALAVGGGGQ